MTEEGGDFDVAIKALEGEFTQLIGHIRRRYAEAANEISEGMIGGSYKVLLLISKHGPITSSDLTEILVLDKAQVSRTVKDLEERGLVGRTTDPRDKRASLLELTDYGRERLNASNVPRHRSLGEALQGFTPEKIHDAARLMRALYEYADSRP